MLQNSKCDKTQPLKLDKTKNVTKLKSSNGNITQKLEMLQNTKS